MTKSSYELEFEQTLQKMDERLYVKWNEHSWHWEVWRTQGPKPTFTDSFIYQVPDRRRPDARDIRWFRDNDTARISTKDLLRQMDERNARIKASAEKAIDDHTRDFTREYAYEAMKALNPSRSRVSMHQGGQ